MAEICTCVRHKQPNLSPVVTHFSSHAGSSCNTVFMDNRMEVLIKLIRQKSHPVFNNTRGIKYNNWQDVKQYLEESGATVTGKLLFYGYLTGH